MTATATNTENRNRTIMWVGFWGVSFGFTLGMIGFGDFGELNAMFTFQSWRMFLAFAGGVVIAAAAFFTIGRDKLGPRQPIHKGIVPGAALFGAGWALTGGCPAIPIVQVATGYAPGLVTLVGVATGMRIFKVVNTRYLRLDPGSCGL